MFSKLMCRVLSALVLTVAVSVVEAASMKSCPDTSVNGATITHVEATKDILCEDVWDWVINALDNDGGQSKVIDDSSYRLLHGKYKGMVVTRSSAPEDGGGPKDSLLILTLKKGSQKVIVEIMLPLFI